MAMTKELRKENARRVGRAADALRDYLKDDKDNAVRDFLSDLRHYCDAYRIDLSDEDRIAHDNYLAELDDGTCDECHGQGHVYDDDSTNCSYCQGSGMARP